MSSKVPVHDNFLIMQRGLKKLAKYRWMGLCTGLVNLFLPTQARLSFLGTFGFNKLARRVLPGGLGVVPGSGIIPTNFYFVVTNSPSKIQVLATTYDRFRGFSGFCYRRRKIEAFHARQTIHNCGQGQVVFTL